MHLIPALFSAVTPFEESSMTKHFPGGIPHLSETIRKMSGAGLPYFTSSPLTMKLK